MKKVASLFFPFIIHVYDFRNTTAPSTWYESWIIVCPIQGEVFSSSPLVLPSGSQHAIMPGSISRSDIAQFWAMIWLKFKIRLKAGYTYGQPLFYSLCVYFLLYLFSSFSHAKKNRELSCYSYSWDKTIQSLYFDNIPIPNDGVLLEFLGISFYYTYGFTDSLGLYQYEFEKDFGKLIFSFRWTQMRLKKKRMISCFNKWHHLAIHILRDNPHFK